MSDTLTNNRDQGTDRPISHTAKSILRLEEELRSMRDRGASRPTKTETVLKELGITPSRTD